MRIKLLGLILVLSIVLLLVSMSSKEESNRLFTKDTLYSYKYTDSRDTIDVEVVATRNDHYYTDFDSVKEVSIQALDTILPVELKSISLLDSSLEQDENYYLFVFRMSLNIVLEDDTISMEDANLHITYVNDESVKLEIGELHYVFDDNRHPLEMYHLEATYDPDNHQLISGIEIELHNSSNQSLSIQAFDIVSDGVSLNNTYSRLVDSVDQFASVRDIIGTEYSPYYIDDKPRSYVMYKDQTTRFFIPISIEDDSLIVERFVVSVDYVLDGVEDTIYLDDFRFVNTSTLLNFSEEGWNECVIDGERM
jgi:hypothetical protein